MKYNNLVKKLLEISDNLKSDSIEVKLGVQLDSGNINQFFVEWEDFGTYRTSYFDTPELALKEANRILKLSSREQEEYKV